MPGYNTEADYENAIIELFRNDLGYEYVYGPDVERDFRSPLYDTVLEESLYRLNKGLPADAINDALFKLRNFENGELVQKNAEFMEYLQSGIPVRYLEKGEERSGIVYLADYSHPENNSFIVANQWTFIENSNKRPDIILFLNGLPVVLVELKSPSREETDASEAYRQLRNYMQEIPSMFIYNAICVMSDQSTSKAGTITSGEDRFMEWKTKDGSYENTQYAQFDTFFEGLFQKDRLLDIIKNFIQHYSNAPLCALHLADMQFARGMYKDVVKTCNYGIAASAEPRPSINTPYLLLLRVMSKDHILVAKANHETVNISEVNAIRDEYKLLLEEFPHQMMLHSGAIEERRSILKFVSHEE